MLKENFYIGDIKKCTKLEVDLIEKNGHVEYDAVPIAFDVVLYKTKTGNYIDIENFYVLELLMLVFTPNSKISQKLGVALKTRPMIENDYFVEELTLRPYLEKFDQTSNKISPVKQLKKMFGGARKWTMED